MTKYIATLLDGNTLTEKDYNAPSLLPLEKVKEIKIINENHFITIKPNLQKGEKIHYFKRNTMAIGVQGLLSIDVYEIKKDNSTVSRIYWHPEDGPIFSTQDLHFNL